MALVSEAELAAWLACTDVVSASTDVVYVSPLLLPLPPLLLPRPLLLLLPLLLPLLLLLPQLLPLPGANFRVTADSLAEALAAVEWGVRNRAQPDALSITQASEHGTVYRLDEIAALGALAHGKGLKLHMDGARFANALSTLGCTPAEMTWRRGVDIL